MEPPASPAFALLPRLAVPIFRVRRVMEERAMNQRTNIQRGMAVMSRDGVQLGRVIDVTSDSITIEKGQFFFLRDFQEGPFKPFEVLHQMADRVIQDLQWCAINVFSRIALASRPDLPHCLLEIVSLSIELRSNIVEITFHLSRCVFHSQKRRPENVQKSRDSKCEADKTNNG